MAILSLQGARPGPVTQACWHSNSPAPAAISESSLLLSKSSLGAAGASVLPPGPDRDDHVQMLEFSLRLEPRDRVRSVVDACQSDEADLLQTPDVPPAVVAAAWAELTDPTLWHVSVYSQRMRRELLVAPQLQSLDHGHDPGSNTISMPSSSPVHECQGSFQWTLQLPEPVTATEGAESESEESEASNAGSTQTRTVTAESDGVRASLSQGPASVPEPQSQRSPEPEPIHARLHITLPLDHDGSQLQAPDCLKVGLVHTHQPRFLPLDSVLVCPPVPSLRDELVRLATAKQDDLLDDLSTSLVLLLDRNRGPRALSSSGNLIGEAKRCLVGVSDFCRASGYPRVANWARFDLMLLSEGGSSPSPSVPTATGDRVEASQRGTGTASSSSSGTEPGGTVRDSALQGPFETAINWTTLEVRTAYNSRQCSADEGTP